AFRVVVLAKIGLVANCAARLPVLVEARPVQTVSRGHVLIRIEMVPPAKDGIPGNIECLEAPSVQFDEILLQRLLADDIADSEFRDLAVSAIGVDEIVRALAIEAAYDPLVFEARAIELAKYTLLGGLHERPAVV